jgi:hypothetical protein
MICRCGATFHAPDRYIGTQHCEDFLLAPMFQCPECRTSICAVMWESDDQEQLLSDTAPVFSAARDNREDEESDAA